MIGQLHTPACSSPGNTLLYPLKKRVDGLNVLEKYNIKMYTIWSGWFQGREQDSKRSRIREAEWLFFAFTCCSQIQSL